MVAGATVVAVLAGVATLVADGVAGPDSALGRLKAGNDRFVKNASAPVSLSPLTRNALRQTQAPFATVLSCADARIPPELIFNVGLGDLYVVRSAGEVVDRSVLASIEYGVDTLHTPLLLVMGHESCDIVQAAVDGDAKSGGPNFDYLLKAIRSGSNRTAVGADLKAAILANVEQVINDTLAGSERLRSAVDAGRVQVVGGYYEMASGRVRFSDAVTAVPVPRARE